MPPATSRPKDVASWLKAHFIGSFENDVQPSLWAWDAGYFSITLMSLSYCNAAAALVGGKAQAGSQETADFIQNMVAASSAEPSLPRYAARGGVLYSLFRHGLVHRREPGHLRGQR